MTRPHAAAAGAGLAAPPSSPLPASAPALASVSRTEQAALSASTRRFLLASLSLAQVWFLVPVAFAFSLAASFHIKHSDLFYMMLNGRLMAERGMFPLTVDPFTYAPADPLFFNQPWIAQLLFWAAERTGGYPGLIFVHAVALASAFALLQWLVRRLGASPALAAALTLLALALSATNFSIRPQTFAPLVFVAVFAVLRLSRPGDWRAVVGMGALSLLWANLHGSFFLGVGLCGLHWLGAVLEERSLRHPRVRHGLWLTVAAVLGTLLNPVGPLVWYYAWRAGTDLTNRTIITEWLPLSFDTLTGKIWLATLPVWLALLALRRCWLSPTNLLVLLAFGGLGVLGQRAIMWWGIALAPVLASHLAPRFIGSAVGRREVPALHADGQAGRARTAHRATHRREVPALNAALLALVLGLMVLNLPWFRALNPLLAEDLRRYLSADHPTGAVAYLQQQGTEGRLFARMEWGGYLAWNLWPGMRVFLDARIEQRPPAVWADYFTILGGRPGWDQLLDQYGADYLLLERGVHTQLIGQLRDHSGWREVYRDELSALYARTQA